MDTLGNLLTTIRNAEMVKKISTPVLDTKQNREVLNILKDQGVIAGYSEIASDSIKKQLDVKLTKVRHSLKRVSKPGRRVYTPVRSIPTIRYGKGFVIMSTSKGFMTGHKARKQLVGGEIICEVY